jgi:hypothetical protein
MSTVEKEAEARGPNQDVESGREKIGHWKMILDQGVVTKEVAEWEYEGEGTEEDRERCQEPNDMA